MSFKRNGPQYPVKGGARISGNPITQMMETGLSDCQATVIPNTRVNTLGPYICNATEVKTSNLYDPCEPFEDEEEEFCENNGDQAVLLRARGQLKKIANSKKGESLPKTTKSSQSRFQAVASSNSNTNLNNPTEQFKACDMGEREFDDSVVLLRAIGQLKKIENTKKGGSVSKTTNDSQSSFQFVARSNRNTNLNNPIGKLKASNIDEREFDASVRRETSDDLCNFNETGLAISHASPIGNFNWPNKETNQSIESKLKAVSKKLRGNRKDLLKTEPPKNLHSEVSQSNNFRDKKTSKIPVRVSLYSNACQVSDYGHRSLYETQALINSKPTKVSNLETFSNENSHFHEPESSNIQINTFDVFRCDNAEVRHLKRPNDQTKHSGFHSMQSPCKQLNTLDSTSSYSTEVSNLVRLDNPIFSSNYPINNRYPEAVHHPNELRNLSWEERHKLNSLSRHINQASSEDANIIVLSDDEEMKEASPTSPTTWTLAPKQLTDFDNLRRQHEHYEGFDYTRDHSTTNDQTKHSGFHALESPCKQLNTLDSTNSYSTEVSNLDRQDNPIFSSNYPIFSSNYPINIRYPEAVHHPNQLRNLSWEGSHKLNDLSLHINQTSSEEANIIVLSDDEEMEEASPTSPTTWTLAPKQLTDFDDLRRQHEHYTTKSRTSFKDVPINSQSSRNYSRRKSRSSIEEVRNEYESSSLVNASSKRLTDIDVLSQHDLELQLKKSRPSQKELTNEYESSNSASAASKRRSDTVYLRKQQEQFERNEHEEDYSSTKSRRSLKEVAKSFQCSSLVTTSPKHLTDIDNLRRQQEPYEGFDHTRDYSSMKSIEDPNEYESSNSASVASKSLTAIDILRRRVEKFKRNKCT